MRERLHRGDALPARAEDRADVAVLVGVDELGPRLRAHHVLRLDEATRLVLLVELQLVRVRLLEEGERVTDAPGLVVLVRVHVDAAQRLVRVVLERLVAQHAHVLLDGLVRVVGTGDEVELGEDLGTVGPSARSSFFGSICCATSNACVRRLVVLEARPIDLAEAVEQTDLELVEHRVRAALAACA